MMLQQADSVIPDDVEFAFGLKEETKGKSLRSLYLLKKAVELKGDAIRDAMHEPNQSGDLGYMGTWQITLEFNRKAANRFAAITGANIGRFLAIVLDGIVQAAPQIQQRIPQGRAVITGRFTVEEARDLAVVLRAGALPAPVKIIEERSVGPSLGRDSITKGIRASLIGAAVVILFMLIYYSLSGFVADFALFLNILILIGVLSVFQGTLTMPGIAGVALTIAMSVDANILIFERIREELRIGKTIRTAIDQGYNRAWLAIFDSNVTTIITALVIYILGTGPIRGFALTLIIGLVANLLTAVFVTRAVFDYVTSRFEMSKLRI
jgi:protein-export membrane protein SecD